MTPRAIMLGLLIPKWNSTVDLLIHKLQKPQRDQKWWDFRSDWQQNKQQAQLLSTLGL